MMETERRDLNYWTEMMFRRRVIFIETAAVVFALVVVGTFLWPPLYQSNAEILVQDNRAQLLVSPGLQTTSPQNPAIIANPVSEEDLNSEVELLTSVYLAKEALRGLPRQADRGDSALIDNTIGLVMAVPNTGYRLLHNGPTLTPLDQWAIKLQHHLNATVIKRSNIVEIDFKSHDAKWSHDFLDRLINQYLDYHVRLSHDPQAAEFFNQQAKLLNARLQASEEKLRQMQVQTGITSLQDQRAALVTRVSDLQIALGKNQADLAAAKETTASLKEQLAQTPQRIGKESRSVQNLALQQIKPELMKLESQRSELLTRYQPDSKRIAEINARISAAQRILDRENHLEVTEVATDLNPIWVTDKSSYDQSAANLASLQAGHESLKKQIDEGRQQLTDMANNGMLIDRLQRQVDADKEAYLSYVRKNEEARAAQGLNTNKILNVSLAQAPNEPLTPKFPIVWLNLMLGFFLALGAGALAAYSEELSDPRIYSTYTIRQASGAPTVAVLRNDI